MEIFIFNWIYVFIFFFILILIWFFLKPDLDDWEIKEHKSTMKTFFKNIKLVEIEFYTSTHDLFKENARYIIRRETEYFARNVEKIISNNNLTSDLLIKDIERLTEKSNLVNNTTQWSLRPIKTNIEIVFLQKEIKIFFRTPNKSETYFHISFFIK